MQTKWMQTGFLLVGLATLTGVTARAQTDVAASLYGAFNGTTTANGVTQSPSNAAGGLLEVRHIAKPWFGYEGTYSFNRANQTYSEKTYPVCGVCNASTIYTQVSNNAHELTGDWVASLKIRNLRPFALAGGGVLFDVPSGQATTTTVITLCGVGPCTPGSTTSTTSASTTTKPVFVYGAGVDWGLLPHIGLRLQYRGNLYKAPDLTKVFTSTNAFTHTAEPVVGVCFRL
jgi:opacity protein-like surface antigen